MRREFRCAIECRADPGRTSPGRIAGTLIEQGRVAADRREIFAPGALAWPTNGIRLLAEHRGRQVLRFQPIEDGTTLRIDEPLPDTALGREVAAEIRAGRKRAMSIEFMAGDEETIHGIREVRAAVCDAAALVTEGAYSQATVEVREKTRRRLWL